MIVVSVKTQKGSRMKVSSKLIAGIVLCAGLVHMASAEKIQVKKQIPNMKLEYAVVPSPKVGRDNPTPKHDHPTPKYKKLGKNGLISVNKKRNDIYFRKAGQTEGRFVTLETDPQNYQILIDEEGNPTIKRLQ